jgi:hypothetical protein
MHTDVSSRHELVVAVSRTIVGSAAGGES